MNRCAIIGNLTHNPELRTTQTGVQVCNFTVAVNKRVRNEGQSEADFFRVSAWRTLGANCAKYLTKGRKVYVAGCVTARAYTGRDGTARAALELTADEVEFLGARSPQDTDEFVPVDDDGLPEEFR